MITIIPIEPLNDEHAFLVIEAFNRLFINKGGQQDGWGFGKGWGHGNGRGDGYGYGNSIGDGYGIGDGGWDDGDKCPEEWRAE